MSILQCVRLPRNQTLEFYGTCLASVVALNHDDTVRRQFRLYECRSTNAAAYVAERIDDPDTIDVRYWGAHCDDELAVYDFFGNEPLANYLYGRLGIAIPGLQSVPL